MPGISKYHFNKLNNDYITILTIIKIDEYASALKPACMCVRVCVYGVSTALLYVTLHTRTHTIISLHQ